MKKQYTSKLLPLIFLLMAIMTNEVCAMLFRYNDKKISFRYRVAVHKTEMPWQASIKNTPNYETVSSDNLPNTNEICEKIFVAISMPMENHQTFEQRFPGLQISQHLKQKIFRPTPPPTIKSTQKFFVPTPTPKVKSSQKFFTPTPPPTIKRHSTP